MPTAKFDIQKKHISVIIQTDASNAGWGAVVDSSRTGGRWALEEAESHINVLELKAALLGLKALCGNISDSHIQLQMDNTTAVTYVNNKGGTHSVECNHIAQDIWSWGIQQGNWLSATHIPGVCNGAADHMSRVFHDNTEWKLNPDIFSAICLDMGTGRPNIDLFASRLNYQVIPYVSWMPDPDALAIDAFSIYWSDYFFYAFPPFSQITRVLRKIREDKATGLIVVPSWHTQAWFPLLKLMAVKPPLELPWTDNLLTLPYKEGCHPLGKKLKLAAWHLSGKH